MKNGKHDRDDDETAEGPPLVSVLVALAESLDRLVDSVESGGLDGLCAVELVRFLRDWERIRNRMALVDHRALAVAEQSGLAAQLTQSSLTAVLVQALRLSPAEAKRRVRAAATVGTRLSMLGERLPPLLPHLAAGQRAGRVSPEQVAVVERAMHLIDIAGLDPAQIVQAEQILAGHALTFGPAELRRIAVRVVDAVHPDGTLPADQLTHDRRYLSLTRQPDGSFRLEGRLTPALGAQLIAALSPVTKPQPVSISLADGRVVEEPDPRTPGQRMHDGLEDLCARLLRAGGLPSSGGTPATVIVTINHDQLLTQTGHATTTDGTRLPVADLLRLANEADILPAVLTTSGILLDLGRSRRVANHNQTYALIARDRGCSFPGCAHPPEYCDRHHIVEWVDGGLTNLDNMTLLCRWHHTHFAGNGWTCHLNTNQLPEWTPPPWIDPHQQPLVNTRITATHTVPA